MMDHTAIAEIQKSITTGRLNDELAELKLISVPLIARPKEFDIQSLEQYMPAPTRQRGAIFTTSVNDFVQFTLDNKQEDATICLIDAEAMKANARLNHGTSDSPGFSDHSITLALKETPDYVELQKINGSKKSQRDLAEWVEEYVDNLTFLSADGTEIPSTKAFTAIRNVKEKAVQESENKISNFEESRGVLASASMTTDNMPAYIQMNITAYPDLEDRVFNMRVSYHKDSGSFSLRVIKLTQIQDEMAVEFADLVRGKLDGISVYIGRTDRDRY
tara:strand:- start:771 stop:1595 length:825 start_codon:yes stop_codon:yes gene_type:complete